VSPKANKEAYAAVYISLPWHQKVLDIPAADRLAAFGFYCATLALCQAFRNDGHVPAGQLAAVIDCSKTDRERLVAELIDVHLFDAVDGGIQVHDFTDHNNSKAEIEAAWSAMSEGGRKGGKLAGAGRPKVALSPTPKGSREIEEPRAARSVGAVPSRAVARKPADPECETCGGTGRDGGAPCWCTV